MGIVHKVGKTKIRIEVEGCTECGTEYSTGWSILKTIPVKVGATTYQVGISICAGCLNAAQEAQTKRRRKRGR